MDEEVGVQGDDPVSDRFLTLPNVLSIIRLAGVPLFIWALAEHHDVLAVIVLMASGITDYLDGKIARTFKMESKLGEYLDPLADRLYIFTTLVGLAWRGIIPLWLLLVLVSREVVMTLMLLYLRRRGQIGLPVHFVGKAATFNLLYAFPLLLLADRSDWIGDLARPVGWGFAWWGIVLYWFAAILYALQARFVLSRLPATAK
ncbi:MAG: CDP-alcohol phosphatidyltransferase family protein [Dermatophilaceae bacterium]